MDYSSFLVGAALVAIGIVIGFVVALACVAASAMRPADDGAPATEPGPGVAA